MADLFNTNTDVRNSPGQLSNAPRAVTHRHQEPAETSVGGKAPLKAAS